MSQNKMLIDATHPEETRVVVLRNNRVEEFDYESAARKILRGNIYLAKVTRVEPSLQAAFVDYGGNRHGFLAFNEIHPDYYMIPMADRQALIEEEAAAEAEEERLADQRASRRNGDRDRDRGDRRHRRRGGRRDGREGRGGRPEAEGIDAEDSAVDVSHLLPPESDGEGGPGGDVHGDTQPFPGEAGEPTSMAADAARDEVISELVASEPVPAAGAADEMPVSAITDAPQPIGNVEDIGVEEVEDGEEAEAAEANGAPEPEQVETAQSEDALEEVPSRPRRRMRSYKIQEVIKRKQIILVQVVKEERGTKGAALTTYLSLAGRYTVLMPNTARGGGISRKITNAVDRKKLKEIAEELEVPEGMGLIIRTAGASRTKQEIKRDFEYLLRLWESVRDLTLQSMAPSLVYEEGDLIKRSIRDLYTKDVDEIVVAGESAFKEARDFMRMLMPSHAKNVIKFEEPEPLFTRYGIERQLNAMFSPYVHLRSGGYLVINQTEALVAVDVNSGKSTREFSIEETALNTNIEAAEEIARQLKLRDLAGLIVIDFIDMEEKRNNRSVERRLKEALRFDRARIQVGRISHFGLMEMSRQRLRTGVLEGSTTQCPHCQGTGIIRSVESVALAVLRGLEDALLTGNPSSLVATTTSQVALYILNNKRVFINDMERRTGCHIMVQASDKVQGANFSIERGAARPESVRPAAAERGVVNMDWGFEGEERAEADETVEEAEAGGADEAGETSRSEEGGERGEGRRKRRRRRGRRGGREDFAGAENGERGAHRARPDAEGGTDEEDERPDPTSVQLGEIEEIDDGEEDGDREPNGEREERRAGGDGDSEGEAEGEGQRGERRRRRRGRRGGRRGRGREGLPIGEGPDAAEAGAGAEPRDGEPSYEADDREDDSEPADGDRNGRERPFETPALATDAPVQVASLDVPVAEPRRESEPRIEVAQAPAAPVAAPAAAATPAEESEADTRAARTRPVSSEPVIAKVVVSTDGGATVEEAKPARRGWWSRK